MTFLVSGKLYTAIPFEEGVRMGIFNSVYESAYNWPRGDNGPLVGMFLKKEEETSFNYMNMKISKAIFLFENKCQSVEKTLRVDWDKILKRVT